jgi:hypothetical protein
MAYNQMRPPNIGFPNSLKSDMPYTDVAGNSNSELTTPLNYTSVQAMRNRLSALNGAYYTNPFLDRMTVNDMIFALRSIDDRTTIADYMPVSTA